MNVKFHSTIVRYDGSFQTLSAFLLAGKANAADTETMQFSADGSLDADAFALRYKEEDGTEACLRYDRNGTLFFRRGLTNAVFTLGKTTSFSHQTAYGVLPTEAYTTRLELMEKNGSYLLALTYFAHICGMVQENTMKWKFTR